MKRKIFTPLCLTCLVLLASCKKFVELSAPATSLTKTEVYSSNDKATAVVSYIYYDMVNTLAQGSGGIGFLSSLSADELTSYTTSTNFVPLVQNSIPSTSTTNLAWWTEAYKDLYQANLAMESIAASGGITEPVKNQLNGECKFIRAFINFHLVNFYGKIPLELTSAYQTNSLIARSPVNDVYQSITADLKDAQSLLTDSYLSGSNAVTTDRIRPNKAAATALLARVYLYTGDWANAETQATSLINNTTTYKLEPDLNSVFLTTSKEAIWELQAPTAPYYTLEGTNYIMIGSPITYSFSVNWTSAISASLLSAFETNDARRTKWVNSITSGTSSWNYPYKYKSSQYTSTTIQENLVVFRLAEQYLIRAEARAQQGKLTGAGSAAEDVNAIRLRAGLGNTAATTPGTMMLAIEQERKVELFTEMGHRWFDLKRWKGFNNTTITRADEVMPAASIIKGSTWDPTHALFPIPSTELKTNPKLDPNPGYTL